MFEDFSFSSPSSDLGQVDEEMVDADSSRVSPRSSRSPSPSISTKRQRPTSSRLRQRRQPPKSIPLSHSHHRRLSVGLLADKLNAQTLSDEPVSIASRDQGQPSPVSPSTASAFAPHPYLSSSVHKRPRSLPTPPDTDYTDDEVCDPLPLPVSLRSISRSSYGGPTSAPSPTSMPSSHPSLDSQSSVDFSLAPYDSYLRHPSMVVRSQRQRLSIIQCGISSSLGDISAEKAESSLLPPSSRKSLHEYDGDEECHPSSLPQHISPNRKSIFLTRAHRMHSSSVSFPTHLSRHSSATRSVSGSGSRSKTVLPPPPNSISLGPVPLCSNEKVGKPRNRYASSSSSSSSSLTARNLLQKQTMFGKALTSMLEATYELSL